MLLVFCSACGHDKPTREAPRQARHHKADVRHAGLRARSDVSPSGAAQPSQYETALSSVVVVFSSSATGSGFCAGRAAIVTNAHVVGRDRRVSVQTRTGAKIRAAVVRVDARRDLALLRSPGACKAWLPLANEGEAAAGADLVAVGMPKGLSWSLSRGIVSAVRHTDGYTVIQTDAPINAGNSGGPLVSTTTGHVLGVVTSTYAKGRAEGLGFAVGADEVVRAFPGLRR